MAPRAPFAVLPLVFKLRLDPAAAARSLRLG
jgi:hypothetical protein